MRGVKFYSLIIVRVSSCSDIYNLVGEIIEFKVKFSANAAIDMSMSRNIICSFCEGYDAISRMQSRICADSGCFE